MGFRRWLLILVWVAGMSWTAQGKQLAVIADTANPTTNLTTAELVKIVNARTQTWPDGRAIKLIVRDPSCADMQLVVPRLLAMPPEQAQAVVHAHRGAAVLAGADDAVVRCALAKR